MTLQPLAAGEIAKMTKVLLKKRGGKPYPVQEKVSGSIGLRDCIAARAYALFEERGCRHGWDLQDWLDAEREILSRQPPA